VRIGKLPVYYLEWDDSCATHGWDIPDTMVDLPSRIKSVGILVSENKESLTISTSISNHQNAMDKLTIPKSCIRKKKRVHG
jgi:hypothetical protein